MKQLSVIIPFAGEYPQVLFTIQATAQSLLCEGIDFEIIAVDNYCEELVTQHKTAIKKASDNAAVSMKMMDFAKLVEKSNQNLFPFYEANNNRSGAAIKAAERGNEWLKYIAYDEKLSHWQAKKLGVKNARSNTYLFLDGHTVPSGKGISGMLEAYDEYRSKGTMHMPLTYKILEWHRLIYKLVIEGDYYYTYSFTGFRPEEKPYEVPCMSTCGMMISKEVYEKVGGWPKGLGVYGGGENFMNYALAVTGMKKWIYPDCTLFHHGEKRDYHFYYDDTLYNRLLSHYLFGGVILLDRFASNAKGDKRVIENMRTHIIDTHFEHRKHIKKNHVIDIDVWAERWR